MFASRDCRLTAAADSELRQLLAAQASQIASLTASVQALTASVTALSEENARLRAELAEGRKGPQAAHRVSKPLSELLRLYIAGLQVKPKSKATIQATLAPAVRHFMDRPADDINRADWIHWRDNVRAKVTTVRKGPPTPYTLNLEIKRWRAVYRWGQVEEHCHTNPLTQVKLLKAKKHRHTRPSEEEVIALLSQCGALLLAFVVVGARTGMRSAEVRNLEWSEIDLDHGQILLPWNKTKTDKERRVPLTSDAVQALRLIKGDIGRYVFENPDTHKPYGRTKMWMMFREAVDKAGLQAAAGDGRVVYHDLRHAFMSWAVGRVPLPVAIAISGHSDLRSASRYIQVSDDQLIEAQRELDKAVREGPRRAWRQPKPGSAKHG